VVNRAGCRHFQSVALTCSRPGKTFNPKVVGSIPTRPIQHMRTNSSSVQTSNSKSMSDVTHFGRRDERVRSADMSDRGEAQRLTGIAL
jgi:hypothetical protein